MEATLNAVTWSPRLQRLALWIQHNHRSQFTPAELAIAIGSRRHANETIVEGTKVGLLRRVGNLLLSCAGFVESVPIRAPEAAGQVVVEPSPPPASDSLNSKANSFRGPTFLAPNVAALQLERLQHKRTEYNNVDSRIDRNCNSRIADSGNSRIDKSVNSRIAISVDSRIAEGGVSEYPFSEGKRDTEETRDQRVREEEEVKITSKASRTRRARTTGTTPRQLQLKAQVRSIIRTGGTQAPPDSMRAYGLAVAYERALATYTNQPGLRYLKGRVAPGEPNWGNWLRAAQVADDMGVDYDTFVRAQFWAFDRWYSRAPKPQELGSTRSEQNAGERVRQFFEAAERGEVDVERRIVGLQRSVIDTTTARGRRKANISVPRDQRFAYAQRQLHTLMRNYDCSEEQILRTFCTKPGAYFDREWLQENPTYRRLLAAGEV